jgi:hypothetical protein
MGRREDSKPSGAEWVRAAVTLRTVVAAMGERLSPPWWRTQFLTEAGLRSMRRIFPRTALGAAVASVSEVARAEHDSRVGVGGRYHLFRLPTGTEEDLAGALSDPAFALELNGVVNGGLEVLLATLDLLSAGSAATPKEGPISLGDERHLGSQRALAAVAALYRGAASSATRCYPYFEELR